jgi:ABC-2 type transport system ATP-binding protein
MTSALELTGVTKRYGDFTAVHDLSFSAAPGKILGFLGPNGAGKTSTLRMVLGLIEPTAGSIRVLGETDPAKVRARIGFLPEERGLYRRMTPVDAITFLAGLKGVPRALAKRRARERLEAAGLGEAADRQIRALSKGMAQKVQLLSALAHDPELVILDEPFSGLDPVNQQSLEAMVRDLTARGATVVFSTHVMQHAERLCDHVVLLAKGKKVFDGSVAEALARPPRTLVLEGELTPDAVAALPGVESVQTAGAELTARLKPGAAPQDALKAAFAAGLDVTRFEMKAPSLHDAFILLTDGGGEA